MSKLFYFCFMLKRTYNILLVEDNPGDIRIIKEVLSKSRFSTNLITVFDGEDVISYLEQASLKLKSFPDIIILDLNLPKLNGIEVIREIKSKKKFRQIPIIILTSSKSDIDINDAYKNYANSYIVKPINFNDYSENFLEILEYWFNIASLPYSK
ncbi:MAG: response regulator [Chitinophagaceae bacterium]|nr:MAG: response regulator [Chitinophagaceae bacterium]